MSRTVSAATAKAQFAQCLRSVELGEAVLVTRYGKTVAAIVAPEEWDKIERLRAAGPEAGLASLVGAFSDADELVEVLSSLDGEHPSPRPPLDPMPVR